MKHHETTNESAHWSFNTKRDGALKGSGAVRPAAIANALVRKLLHLISTWSYCSFILLS